MGAHSLHKMDMTSDNSSSWLTGQVWKVATNAADVLPSLALENAILPLESHRQEVLTYPVLVLVGLGALKGIITQILSLLACFIPGANNFNTKLQLEIDLIDVLIWSTAGLFAVNSFYKTRNRPASPSLAHEKVVEQQEATQKPRCEVRSTCASVTPTQESLCVQKMEVTARCVEVMVPSKPVSTSQASLVPDEPKPNNLSDAELIEAVSSGKLQARLLERYLVSDMTRAVKIRRAVTSQTLSASQTSAFRKLAPALPFEGYDWEQVYGKCCENVVGYIPLPVGLAGPMVIDGKEFLLPLATTEGALVASTSRGCKAINLGGGAITALHGDGMTRGPCVRFDRLAQAQEAKAWIEATGFTLMKDQFDSTSSFARLQHIHVAVAGTTLYLRFTISTGDAMGMNMASKGTEKALAAMSKVFPSMILVSLSGNFCSDKKAAAINWIAGRGKSVTAEAVIPSSVVKSTLKTDVDSLVDLNVSKNLVGSAMAGSIGGFNAHASNLVTAMFLATGQDPAQNVESSQCITTMRNLHGDLQICVSMPCIEVGTVGGGTQLGPQASILDLLGVKGAHRTSPGANAQQLARIIAAGVLAGELSLCSALASGNLVSAHMAHNRK